MEPISSLTTGVITELAFKKFLETSAGELAKKFTNQAIQKMDKLRQMIFNKLKGNPKAENEINAIQSRTKSNLDRLIVYLEDAMEDDKDFANKIILLAQEINAGKLQDNSNMTMINTDNARGVQNRIEGGTNNSNNYIAAEITINHQASD